MKRLDKVEGHISEFTAKMAAMLSSVVQETEEIINCEAGRRCERVRTWATVSCGRPRRRTRNSTGDSVTVDLPCVPNWSASVPSTPHNHGNRFALLSTDDDGDSADVQPFTVVQNRRSSIRRSSPSTTSPPPSHPSQQPQQQRTARRVPTLYGTAFSVRGTTLVAAKTEKLERRLFLRG